MNISKLSKQVNLFSLTKSKHRVSSLGDKIYSSSLKSAYDISLNRKYFFYEMFEICILLVKREFTFSFIQMEVNKCSTMRIYSIKKFKLFKTSNIFEKLKLRIIIQNIENLC